MALAEDLRSWMFAAALPLWSDRGIDHAHGGYVEQLDLAGRPGGEVKRVRVVCRQIYVFSHASVLGWAEGDRLAERGYAYLTRHAALGGGAWARRLDPLGTIIDATPDLYDLAFVLFALGWRHRASGDPEALEHARRTLDYLDREMRHASGGFLHEKPAPGFRLQNPHMHLLEAALVLFETSGEEIFGALADELVELFLRRFFNPRSGTLAEYFEEDWSPAAGDRGRVVEPGHQFEWAWILANHQRLRGRDLVAAARGLFDFAERHGVDPASRATYDAVRDDGLPLDRGSRTWPNTERMKGAIALYELTRRDPRPVLEESGRLLLDRYLAWPPAGAWMDAFDGEGRPIADKIPASTLYHVFLAFAETLRVAPALGLAGADQQERG
jgi:N-acylglucosamine 2-epimerase/mannose-6-phosphate isomerase